MDGSDLICTPHFMSRPRVYFLRALRGGNDCCFLSTPANMWSFPLTSFSRGLQSESTSPGFRGWKVWAGTTLQLSTWPDTGALCMLSSGSFMRKGVGVHAPRRIQTCLPQQHSDFCVGCLLSSSRDFSSQSPWLTETLAQSVSSTIWC